MGANDPKSLGGRHLPTIESKVQPSILELTCIDCSMTGGLLGTLGCGLRSGIFVVLVEREKFVKN